MPAPRPGGDDDDGRALPRWGTGRVEAFSDGVFAIAITLLVLEIKVDPADFDHLARALAHEWPAYLAYVTSFLTVGGVWLSHHALFSRLRYVDAALSAAMYTAVIVVGIVLVPRLAVIAYLLVAVRSALVIGAGGRLSVPWVSKQFRRIPGFR